MKTFLFFSDTEIEMLVGGVTLGSYICVCDSHHLLCALCTLVFVFGDICTVLDWISTTDDDNSIS